MDRLTYPDIARIFGTGLISTGVGLLLFVMVTVVWGDPFTRISEHSAQQRLAKEFAESQPSAAELKAAALDPELTRRTAARYRKTIPYGHPVGTISIPRLHLKKFFIHGARDQDLSKGPGLYKEVTLPGGGLPLAIAGHRTTHGAPFLNIDTMRPGDKIVLTVPYGKFTYTMTRRSIVKPNDWSILNYGAEEPTSAARRAVLRTRRCNTTCEHLVLTACHPKYSAARRMAVFARLTSVQLVARRGAAAA